MIAPQFPTDVERWVALRTAANWEKKLAEQLTASGVPVFLPMLTRVTQYASKRRAAQVPVFGGYVFCSGSHFLGNRTLAPAARSKVAQVLQPPAPDVLRIELQRLAEVLASRALVQERLAGGRRRAYRRRSAGRTTRHRRQE